MKIQCSITNVNIDLPESSSHLGIMISGGMDSALAAFLIILENKNLNNLHRLTFFNVPNVADNAVYHSLKVINFLNEYFNTKLNLVNIGDGTIVHNKIINEPSKKILKNKLVDVLVSGINQNPKIDLGIEGPTRRNPDLPIPNNLMFPFIKLYKTDILGIYQQFNILDLAYITHSCTSFRYGRCNTCFQCKERQWAFDSLNLENKEL
jgi:hypothetical protein